MSEQDRWMADDVIDAGRLAAIPPSLPVSPGLMLTHLASSTTGEVVAFTEGARVVLSDADGKRHEFAPIDGFFEHNGTRVALRAPSDRARPAASFTASGSVTPEASRAKVARASRIWVEGIHDAELIERIWGDDLREEGLVVEPLHGADDLAAAVADFGPGADRRLGVLLDHLIPGSKESRIAGQITSAQVLITGHPYVDIWQAIKPSAIGIATWPEVPPGRPWKEGVIAGLGLEENTGRFWQDVLGSVSSWTDIETPLVHAVERLIDFVSAPGE